MPFPLTLWRGISVRKLAIWLLVLVLAYLGVCMILAWRYVRPSRYLPEAKPEIAKDVSIPLGAATFPAWATPGLEAGRARSESVFILIHGYGGNRDSWAHALDALAAKGYEVVVPAMPGHDASPDPSVGFGPKEADYVIACARWARSQMKDQQATVVLVGLSMGGSACWLASEKEPGLFGAIVTEDSFAVLDEAVHKWFSMLFPGGRVLFAPARWFANGMAGVDPSKVRPVEAADKWHGRPALVIHCKEDQLMDASHAARLAKAAGCELWTIPNAGHAEGYSVASSEYIDRLGRVANRAWEIRVGARPG